jgi:hypothetical protein
MQPYLRYDIASPARREAFMSDERRKTVMQRFEDRLARVEAMRHEKPARWQVFHLHNALQALPDDHDAADLHLDEFDRHELEKEYPELEADKVPDVDELRTRFTTLLGGTI